MQKSIIIVNNASIIEDNNDTLNQYLSEGWVVVVMRCLSGDPSAYSRMIVIIEKK